MCVDSSPRSPALAVVGFCLTLATNCAAQAIIEGKAGDEYYRFTSLGIDSAGTVLILGEDENYSPTVFRLNGTHFELIHLGAPSSDGNTQLRKISTDARYAIGTFDGSERGVLWDLTRPAEPVDLGSLGYRLHSRPLAVCSSSAGPVVVGQSGLTGFVWTEGTGIRPWVTNRPYVALSAPVGISSDATQVVGWEASISGTNIVGQAIRGNVVGYDLLDSHDSPWAFAEGISPSGDWACGLVDLKSVIWDAKGHPRFLKLGTNIHGLLTITDSGVAGGVSSAGGIIYEGRGRDLRIFDEWWSQTFAQNLQVHVTHVTELHEYAGNYYALAAAFDPVADRTISLVFIFPTSALRRNKGLED